MERVTEEASPEGEEGYRKRRLIDVAERKMVRAGDIVELVSEVAVAAMERRHEQERRSGDEKGDLHFTCGDHRDNGEGHADIPRDET
jgi:hypothetical protein